MRTLARTVTAATLLLPGGIAASAATADAVPAPDAGYGFVVLADSTKAPIENFGCASINDAGGVAYGRARIGPRRNVSQVVRIDPNGRSRVIAADPDRFDFLGPPVINASGQVAFSAVLEDGEQIIRATPGEETIIARTDPGRFAFFAAAVSLNAAGVVAFKAELDPEFDFAEGMYSGSGGAVTEYYRNTSSRFEGTSDLASINDTGRIVFGERVQRRGGIFLTRPQGGFRILSKPREGVDTDDPSTSDHGRVAFERFTIDPETQGITRTEIVAGRPSALTTVISDDGPIASFGFRPPAINDSGTVAYAADLDEGGSGVFVGADADPVVSTGDVVDGDPVTSAVLCENGLNNSGQLVLTLTLDDPDQPSGTRELLVRATPVG